MKHKRLRVEKEVANGWSRWVQPVKRGYLLSCCDCGLVHRMDFRIVNGRTQFRAQRATAYTRRERSSGPKKKLLCRIFGCSLHATSSRGMAGDCVCIRCGRKVPGIKWPKERAPTSTTNAKAL